MSEQGGRSDLDAWLSRERIGIVAVDHTLARSAANAFVRLGKGRQPAGFNDGDRVAHVAATWLGAPWLFGSLESPTDTAIV